MAQDSSVDGYGFAIAECQKYGEGAYVGGMGRDETIEAAAGGAEHAHVFNCVTGAGPAYPVFDKYGDAVGKEKAEDYAKDYQPPAAGFVAKGGEEECRY